MATKTKSCSRVGKLPFSFRDLGASEDFHRLQVLDAKERRQEVVARLPALERLNGSPILEEERLDAERAFLRRYQNSDVKPSRFHELEEVHGKVDQLAKVSLKPQTIFSCDVVMSDGRRERMKVNSMLTTREFKKSLQSFVGLPPSRFTLFYLDMLTAHGVDRMRLPDKKLYTYNISDGDQFIVEPKE